MRKRSLNKKESERKAAIFVKLLGQRFYDLRMARKESIRTVAKKVKMSRAIISKIEKGEYDNFRLCRFVSLCKYYRVKPVDIVNINMSDETIHPTSG
jgi:transcriptional regulator with XRE-family HTH domain